MSAETALPFTVRDTTVMSSPIENSAREVSVS
jgi:hypothetical protein